MKIIKYLFAVLVALYFLGKIFGAGNPPLSAATIVAEGNKTMRYPVDLGDGFRLDGIRAAGNTVVSTVTLLDTPAGTVDAGLVRVIEAAAKSDTCREISSQKQAMINAGIDITKEFKNNAGGMITAVTIKPSDCA